MQDLPVSPNLLKRLLRKTRIIGDVRSHAGFWTDGRKINR
jgi:hypothetical protein